jgi:hypothetical protein
VSAHLIRPANGGAGAEYVLMRHRQSLVPEAPTKYGIHLTIYAHKREPPYGIANGVTLWMRNRNQTNELFSQGRMPEKLRAYGMRFDRVSAGGVTYSLNHDEGRGFPSRLAGFLSALLAVATAWSAPLERRPNNTLRMPQTPAVFGYQFVNAFPGVTFQSPMAIVAPPGETNRLFIVERAGRIAVITNLASPSREVFLDITNKINTSRDGGLQTMGFHPGFATNGYFYVFYTGNDTPPAPGDTNKFHDILARYSVPVPGTNFASPATEQTIIRQYEREGDHNGADIHFGSDGYLYLSLGDEGAPHAVGYDYYTNSQYKLRCRLRHGSVQR